MFVKDCMANNLVLLPRSYITDVWIGYAIKPVLTDWCACIKKDGMVCVQVALKPYVLCGKSTLMYEEIESLEDGYAPKAPADKASWLVHPDQAGVEIVDSVALEVVKRSDAMDMTLWYLATAMFNMQKRLL